MAGAPGVEFDKPYPLTELTAEPHARCTTCGADSAPRPARELVAVLHRVPRNKEGAWRVYCRDHLSLSREFRTADDVATTPHRRPARAASAPAAPLRQEPVQRVICQNCWLEVPAGTRWCDTCEERVPL